MAVQRLTCTERAAWAPACCAPSRTAHRFRASQTRAARGGWARTAGYLRRCRGVRRALGHAAAAHGGHQVTKVKAGMGYAQACLHLCTQPPPNHPPIMPGCRGRPGCLAEAVSQRAQHEHAAQAQRTHSPSSSQVMSSRFWRLLGMARSAKHRGTVCLQYMRTTRPNIDTTVQPKQCACRLLATSCKHWCQQAGPGRRHIR